MRFYDPTELALDLAYPPGTRRFVPCFSNSKSQTSTSTADQRVVANESGKGQSGSSNLQVTDSATLLQVGEGAQVGGAQVKDVTGNVQVETLSGDKLAALLGGIAQTNQEALDTVSSLAAQSTAAASAASQAGQTKLDALISEINTLATDQQSAGYSASQKAIVVVVLAVLALGGLWIYRRNH